jgi:glutamate N-acetyltransferase/amino-acid N-acetyltransferase
MVLLLANGAGSAEIPEQGEAAETFVSLLQEVMLDLAKMVVSDGEGATKLVRIQVEGAASDDDALLAAETVATSNLVKTAFFGEDANWGRIIAAAGYAGVDMDPDQISISFDNVVMVEKGLGLGPEQEALASEVMKKPEFTVAVKLGSGEGRAYYYTSDLSYEYVKINADYRT